MPRIPENGALLLLRPEPAFIVKPELHDGGGAGGDIEVCSDVVPFAVVHCGVGIQLLVGVAGGFVASAGILAVPHVEDGVFI